MSRSWKFQRPLACAGVAAVALALSACGGSGKDEAGTTGTAGGEGGLTKVRVASPAAVGFVPVNAADQLGIFEENGLDVELMDLPSGRVLATALLGGDVEISCSSESTMGMADQGAEAKSIVALTQYTDLAMLSSKDLDVTPADANALKGRKVAVTSFGSGSDILARAYVKQAGLQESDVTFIAAGGMTEAVAALKSGGADFAVIAEPVTSMTVAAGVGDVFLNFSEDAPEVAKLSIFTCFATPKWLEENRETAVAFVKSIGAAEKQLQDEATMIEITQKVLPDVPPDVVEQIASSGYAERFSPEVPESWIDGLNTVGIEVGAVKQQHAYEDVVDAEMQPHWTSTGS